MRAMEMAMKTEKEFLDYVKSLQIDQLSEDEDDDFLCEDDDEAEEDRDTLPENTADNSDKGALPSSPDVNSEKRLLRKTKKKQSRSPSRTNSNPQVSKRQMSKSYIQK